MAAEAAAYKYKAATDDASIADATEVEAYVAATAGARTALTLVQAAAA